MARLGRGFPNNALLRAPRATIPVVFDAAGAGSHGAANPLTWTETVTGNGLLVLGTAYTSTFTTVAATVGGSTSLNPLPGSPFLLGTNFYLFGFGLIGAPTGPQNIAVNFGSAVSLGSAADSVSYKNVAAFGAPVLNSGSGTALSVSCPSAVGQMVAVVMSTMAAYAAAISSFNQTSHYTQVTVASGCRATLIGDAPGAPTVNFTGAFPNASGAWGALAIPIIGI